MTLPTFLIIGVQKAGTTSIYNYLDEHPQIYMSPIKETNFMERDWSKLPPEEQQNLKLKVATFEQYQQLFTAAQDAIAIGEASPNYLLHYNTSIDLIQRYVPDAKMLAILRHPVDRAFSDYLMHVREATGKPTPLINQLRKQPVTSYNLLKGLYYQPLAAFMEHFGRERVRVFLYDDLCQDAVVLMQSIYQYIGVDGTYVPNTFRKAQVAQVPKSQAINQLLRKDNPARSLARNLLRPFFSTEQRQKLRDRLLALNYQDKSAMTLSSGDRQELVDFFRDDILKLQDLIQRDLSSWLQ